jgi:hypothetical protein
MLTSNKLLRLFVVLSSSSLEDRRFTLDSHPQLTSAKVLVSNYHGFTKFTREEYQKLRAEGKLIPDGAHVKYISHHGPLPKAATA